MAIPLLFVALLAGCYAIAALRERGWSRWRTASWFTGCALLTLGLLPDLLPFTEHDLRKHMLQHILLGMLAPLGLVMAAPITLLLRNVPTGTARAIARFLQSPLGRAWANPFTALVFNMGGMAALYFTPLYMAMMVNPALHYLVHFHFVAAGCLWAWVIAGPDLALHRLSVPARLSFLGAAVLIHSVMSQMLYAGLFVGFIAPREEMQRAAELMYYGGDITEMLLAFAMVSTWRPQRRKASVTAVAHA